MITNEQLEILMELDSISLELEAASINLKQMIRKIMHIDMLSDNDKTFPASIVRKSMNQMVRFECELQMYRHEKYDYSSLYKKEGELLKRLQETTLKD